MTVLPVPALSLSAFIFLCLVLDFWSHEIMQSLFPQVFKQLPGLKFSGEFLS